MAETRQTRAARLAVEREQVLGAFTGQPGPAAMTFAQLSDAIRERHGIAMSIITRMVADAELDGAIVWDRAKQVYTVAVAEVAE